MTYLGLQKVAWLERASCDGRRSLLGEGFHVFGAFYCKLLAGLCLLGVVVTNNGRIEQLPELEVDITC